MGASMGAASLGSFGLTPTPFLPCQPGPALTKKYLKHRGACPGPRLCNNTACPPAPAEEQSSSPIQHKESAACGVGAADRQTDRHVDRETKDHPGEACPILHHSLRHRLRPHFSKVLPFLTTVGSLAWERGTLWAFFLFHWHSPISLARSTPSSPSLPSRG